jgi:hypothetical protein
MSATPQQKTEPGEVSVSSSPGSLPDRAIRIVAILDRLDAFKGMEAAQTILDDERKNLAQFLALEDCPHDIRARITAALK